MKRIPNECLIDPFTDEPGVLNVADETGKMISSDPMTMAAIIRMIIQSFRGARGMPQTTIEDGDHGIAVLQALRPFKKMQDYLDLKTPKYIELEEADYRWLKEACKVRLPLIFNIMCNPILKVFDKTEKLAEEKAADDKADDKKAAA